MPLKESGQGFQREEYEDSLPCSDSCNSSWNLCRINTDGMVYLSSPFGMVISLELVNTAVEAVVDLVTEERKPFAKIAKDTAAGAVLLRQSWL